MTSFLYTVHIFSIMSCMIRHKGLQTWSSASVAFLRIEGAPKHHIGSLLQTPPCVLVLSSHALCALGRVLFCSFSDLVLSKTMELNPIALFCSSLVAFYSCSLVACAFFQLFGCELFLFVVSPSVFKLKSLLHFEFHWVGVWEISTLHICFIPGHMYPIKFTHLFSDGIVSQEMPDVGVKE